MTIKTVSEIQDCSTARSGLDQLRNQSQDPEKWKQRTLEDILASVAMLREAIQALRDADGNTVLDRVNDIDNDIEAAELAVMCEQLEKVCIDPGYSQTKLANFFVEAYGLDEFGLGEIATINEYAAKYDEKAADHYHESGGWRERLKPDSIDLEFEKIVMANMLLGQQIPSVSGDYRSALEKLGEENIDNFLRMFDIYTQFRYLAWSFERGLSIGEYDKEEPLKREGILMGVDYAGLLQKLVTYMKNNNYVFDSEANKIMRFESLGRTEYRQLRTGRWTRFEDVSPESYYFNS